MQTISHLIVAELHTCLQDNSVNIDIEQLTHDVVLFESGLDSLGFAVLVTRLEILLGYDPFTLEPNPFYPKNLGEFIAIYEKYEKHRKNV